MLSLLPPERDNRCPKSKSVKNCVRLPDLLTKLVEQVSLFYVRILGAPFLDLICCC
jgi:hypothetical protein